MRTVKQIKLIYISQEWFLNGKCLVIDKKNVNKLAINYCLTPAISKSILTF